MKWSLFNLLQTLFALLGAISAIIAIYQFISSRYVVKKFRWREVENGVIRIIDNIAADGFDPNFIICLGRGGSIIGGLIAGNLGVKRLCSIDRSRVRTPADALMKPKFIYCPNFDSMKEQIGSEKLKILLITGEMVTGFDLGSAMDFLKEIFNQKEFDYEIKTVAFLTMNTAIFEPDYVAKSRLQKYIVPPWRIRKEYVNDRRADGLVGRQESS